VQLIVAGGNRAGQVIPVSTEKFVIGRAADCHLKPTSDLISRYHCALLVDAEVVVRDLGSRDGVRLNGERINSEQKVNNGDRLGVGPLEFFVSISDDEASAGQPENQNISSNQPAEGVETRAGESLPTMLMNHSARSNQEPK
jgi:pSer/pThr/pTyr-binding forkhead associated (FHA) protein